jgi:hypothetical protein
MATLPPALENFCQCITRANKASCKRQERFAAKGLCWMHAQQPVSGYTATTP